MDIKELVKKKKNAENTIMGILYNFTEETGVQVKDVSINIYKVSNVDGKTSYTLSSVDIDVSL